LRRIGGARAAERARLAEALSDGSLGAASASAR
jgi:hypothetical protein